ncbi:MFS transporter [Phenylobacterium sp.]|jgi:MFS family permease|uniref:MFS transporter n=1 Tax=Phenylobacterium sp. TaxID=1871053 RepID=UPI0037CA8C91
MTKDPANSWADLLAGGRAPRFLLICLGVWLNAADSLVTATILPNVGADLGGYAYFAWATAGFFVGAILAGASSGRLSEMFGLGRATLAAGLIMAAGCVMSAAAPDVGWFLAGRVVQGLGSGWISGFAMVAIALLFPERHLARVFAAVTFVWGIATVLGPLVGGLVVAVGDWRDVFWLFALQALAFSLAAPFLLRAEPPASGGPGVPWMQLGVLGVGVVAIALADFAGGPWRSIALVAVGLAVIAVVARIDAIAKIRLLPVGAGDLRTVCGSGYFAMFALTAASMGFSIYAPAILQELRGFSPLEAGYLVGVESMAWTVSALAVAGAVGAWDRRWTRLGAVLLVVSLVVLAMMTGGGHLAWVILGAALLGAGFGFSWAFMSRRILSVLTDEDRAIGSSAITAVRQTGAAAGAAISGVAANLSGFSSGLSAASAQAASVWVFVAVIPLALAGLWATWRMTDEA